MSSDNTIKTDALWLVLKWTTAFIILGVLFYQTDINQVIKALEYAELKQYFPIALFFILCWFLIESQNLAFLFNGFGHSVTFKEMREIRGATYLLMIVNYNLGLGAVALYLNKARGIPFIRTSGMMLFYFFVESVGITFFAASGSLLIKDADPIFKIVFAIAASLFVLYLTIYLSIRLMIRKNIFPRVTNSAILKPVSEVTLSFYLKLSFYRAIYFFSFVLFFYFGLKTFHITIPISTLTALIPVIFFIGNIPVTPFGIGTIQAAMMFFLGPYGSKEALLAFSVLYSSTLLFGRAPIGLFYMKNHKIKNNAANQQVSKQCG